VTKEEIDILWQKAMQESIKYGEMFTRYHFAKMVAEAERERIIAANAPEIERCNAHIKMLEDELAAIKEALSEHAMREVQRLGQEIEQAPGAWLSTDSIGERYLCFDKPLDNNPVQPLFTTPPQRKPLTDEQRKDLMNKAWNKWLGGEDDNHLFAWHFSFEVEAAHNIKENT